MTGIADELRCGFTGTVLEPDDAGYNEARRYDPDNVFGRNHNIKPA